MVATSLPRRDRIAIIASLTAVSILAWIYLVRAAMPGQTGGTMNMMQIPPWDAAYFLSMFIMWSVMMVGMMLPSVAPAVLIYASVARKARTKSSTVAPAWLFTSGYLIIWVVFSLCATLLQWQLDRAALLSPMMVSTSDIFGASMLMAAGVYQWLPAKDACLKHCRSPVHFISIHWKAGSAGAVQMGMLHGLYCLGCCWVLMGLLFVGGVMNLLWIALITLFVLLEKLLPFGAGGGRVAGIIMILAGLATQI